MASVAAKVMSTVSAPYGVLVTAAQLAEKIADIKSADSYDCSVFALLSEVSPKLQQSFIDEMGVARTRSRKLQGSSPISPDTSCRSGNGPFNQFPAGDRSGIGLQNRLRSPG
jgi:hypothetical protein